MKKYIILWSAVLLALCPLSLFAQSGSIAGVLKDAATNETLIGATVVLEGTVKGSTTDIDGKYLITDIPAGTVNISVTYIGYLPVVIKDVKVLALKQTELNISLKQDSKELKGADITARRITHSENAVLAEMRGAQQIVNGVSAQQIAKTQDRAASDVLRRIPGVTVIEDKFIMVRGLSDRYNVVMLNDAAAPSIEPDRKGFSFDLIPAALVDRILIYKSGAPELPGEFAGGAIKIFTRNVPDENMIQLNYSASYRSASTFNTFYKGSSGKFDKFGFDGGERALPSDFPKSLNGFYGEDLSAVGKMLPDNWSITKSDAIPDQRFSFLIARPFNLGKVKAGNITSINYGVLNESRIRTIANFNDYNEDLKKSDPIYIYKDTLSYAKVNLGVISNWSFILNKDHKLEFHNLLNQSGVNQTLIREGANYEAGSYFRNYAVRYNQRMFYTGQVSGEHMFNEQKTKLSWMAGLNTGVTKDPDFRRVQTNRPLETPEALFSIVTGSTASLDQLGRFYSELYENNYSGNISGEHKLNFGKSSFQPVVKAGVLYEKRSRTFDARWMSYIKSLSDNFDYSLLNQPVNVALSNENINPVTGFKLSEGTNPYDSYSNSSELNAAYAGVMLPFTSKISFSGGARYEKYLMTQNTKNELKKELKTELETEFILPSANVTFNMNAKTLIRAAYFKSLNRPEFREIELYSYFDFIRNEVLLGNPDLKTAEVHNADMRFEYYPSTGELISGGVFYKKFNNPIEKYALPGTGGGTRSFQFDNAQSAESYGVETEVRKSLQNLEAFSFLSKLSFTVNASYILSNVNLGEKAVMQDDNRPMMGQSPYMVNAGVFYNDQKKQLQVSLMYNIIGKRLFAIGGDKSQPDIYEMPRHLTDLSITKGFGKHIEVKLGVKDLFNNKFCYMQDVNQDGDFDDEDQTIESYRTGSYFTAGISYRY